MEPTESPPRASKPAAAPHGSVVRNESTIFLVGVIAIAVHIVDDSFLQPEAGTDAADHLVSGFVPLVLLALAALGYPRLRAGARAVLAVGVGLFGVVVGASEGAYHAVNGGFSDDDFTALLALLGGLLLVVMGAVVLWKTRRLDDPRRLRYLRRSLIGVAAIIIGLQLVFPVLFSYGYTHYGGTDESPADLGISHEDVSFETSDGLTLSGWYVPSKNGAAIVVLPAGGRSEGHEHVKMLARQGYGVLIFDPRGTGESEGDPYRWGGEQDVEAALDYLQSRPDVDPDRIGGLGLSLGGELMLETASNTDALKAVVSEGAGIRSIREQMVKPSPAMWLSLPFWATQTAATAVFSNQMPPPNLRDCVARIAPRPVFLIYSGHPVGGEELNADFYDAAGEPKTLWEIPEASHTGGLAARPAEYEQRVVGFFDDALLPVSAQ